MSRSVPLSLFDEPLSRRDFLKFFGLGVAGLALPKPLLRLETETHPKKLDMLFGRVTVPGHKMYRAPDFNSGLMEELPLDSIWPITKITTGGDKDMVNRVWYELDWIGYAHSSRIQPVRELLNDEEIPIPEEGCLGEVTMPYVDAHSHLDGDRSIAYRFYYASTFWVLSRQVDEAGDPWYEILDDKYYQSFYVPAAYLRLVPDAELTPISPDVPADEKWIAVDLATQTLTAYEGDRVALTSRISSGVRLKEGGFATPKGQFRIVMKRPCRHMATQGNEFGTGFDLPGVPWVSYFTSGGVAFHGAYWHNNFGIPSSHGCVNMKPRAAKWLYRWTTPTVPADEYYHLGAYGTRVIVQ